MAQCTDNNMLNKLLIEMGQCACTSGLVSYVIFFFFYFDNFKTYCSHGSEDICKKTEVQQYSDITDFECVY